MHNYYMLIKAFEKTKSTIPEEQYPRFTSGFHINGRAGDEPRNSGIFTMTLLCLNYTSGSIISFTAVEAYQERVM